MSQVILVLCLAGFVVVVFAWLKRRRSVSVEWPVMGRAVMSVPEQVLYWRLIQALPDHLVLAQVQLCRFMEIGKTQRRQTVLNRIDRKSADFLICSKDAQPLCVIELDDSSHAAPRRKKADADKDAAVRAAGIRMVRFHVKALPDIAAIRAASIGAAPPTVVAAR